MNENSFVVKQQTNKTKIDQSLSNQFRPSQNDRLMHIFQDEICWESFNFFFLELGVEK